MAASLRHGTAPGALPTSASVLEFICLFTHDLKRKQKRWQDGTLKYHTFNKRIMVSDDRGHFIGDAHWQTGGDIEPGDEFELDRGAAIVQVSDCTGQREQDLTELLDKRAREVEKRRANAVSRTPRHSTIAAPSPAQDQSPHFQLRHRPLASVVGTPSRIGRAVISPHSPYEIRQMAHRAQQPEQHERPAQAEDPPPLKRRKHDMLPPGKSSHARSLFGAALTLTPLPTTTPSAQVQLLRDRPNASLKSLLPIASDMDQNHRQPRHLIQQPVEVESSPDLATTDPRRLFEVPINRPLKGVCHSVAESKKPKVLEVESSSDASTIGPRRLLEADTKRPTNIHCSITETKKPKRCPLSDSSNIETPETLGSSPTSPAPISVTSVQPKKRPISSSPPRTASLQTGRHESNATKEQQPNDNKLPKEKASRKETETPRQLDDHNRASAKDEPRTELRIRSRQRRGLLVMSKKHGQEHNPVKRSETSSSSLKSGHPQQGEVVMPNAEEPTSADVCSDQALKQNTPIERHEARIELATSVISADLQVLDDASKDDDDLPKRGLSPEIELRSIRTHRTGKSTGTGSDETSSKTNTRSLRDRRTRKQATQVTTRGEEDEADPTATSLAPKASDQMHGSRTSKSSSSGPRIAKMARKSVKSKEIIGFVVPSDEPTMAPLTFAAHALVTNSTVGNTIVGNIVGGEAESSHMDETSKPTAQPGSVAQSAATGSSDDKSKARPKARPTPRLSNPASRGKKAARLEDAAGLVPQAVMQLDPVAPTRVGAPKPRPASAKPSELPGFTKANGGAWSRHAEDLLGMTRPAEKQSRRR
ncbi:hypothetical protein QQZ08_000733 [Neonectria magnoliae]|uniref:5'-3' DNA helicase ZGRF1-like N-terminal domain-containing protein n=1 Tax=Neonectria magnoliae TaxID=2732573 RepID=A0ABR1IGU8_9HYPO